MMKAPNIATACHTTPDISNEQFIPEHIFIHMVAGTMTVYDGNKEYFIVPGDYCLATRNHLAKYIKLPPEGGKFKTVSMFYSHEFLKGFCEEYGYTADPVVNKEVIIKLAPNAWFDNYIQSITPYLELSGKEYDDLMAVKRKESMLLLLKTNPSLKNILLDLTDPGKIDLEAFMNRNFRFNVSLQRFSYLTGRSLTTFKRDFEKIFNVAPGRWLLEKRLQEAHFLMEKKGEAPSDAYLEVGFEDLSHFSFAFKKMYGISPNQLKKAGR